MQNFLKELPFKAPVLNYRDADANGKYLTGWALRAYLLDIMGMEGVTLKINADATMASFTRMNPDKKNHLARLQKMFLQTMNKSNFTPAKLCKELGVYAHPELLSFLACFAADGGFEDADFENFQARKWWDFAHQYFAEHGLEPHPAIVAQGLRKPVQF